MSNYNIKTEAVQRSEELLLQYEGARTSWAEEARLCEDFFLGDQWSADQKKILKDRRQSPVVINVIHSAVEQAVAMLTTNKPRFSSSGREDSDTKTGKIMSDIMSFIWEESEGNSEAKIAIYEAYVRSIGYGILYVDPYGNYGKGSILFKSIDSFNVYVDPNAKDKFFRDAANIILCQIITGEEAMSMFPDVDLSTAEESRASRTPQSRNSLSDGASLTNSYIHKTFEYIDRYSKIKVALISAYHPDSGLDKVFDEEEFMQFLQSPAVVQIMQGQQPIFITREDKVKEAMQIAEQTGGVFYYIQDPNTGQQQMVPGEPSPEDPNTQFMIPGSLTQLQVIPMEALVQNGIIQINKAYQDRILRVISVGGIEIYNGLYGKLEMYPIVPLKFSPERTPYPKSEVMKVKSLQETINKTRSLILTHAANTATSRVLLPRGSMDKKTFEAEWNKAGSAVLEVDMEIGQPIITAPPPLPNELYKAEADLRGDIQEILGIYPMMQGDGGQAPATYKGTVALDEYGQRRIKSKKDDVEAWLNQLAKVAIQFIQMVYTEPMVIRLLRPDNLSKEVQINQSIYDDNTGGIIGKLNDVTVGKYDVVVVSGSMLPSNRWAQAEYYMELYKNGIIDQVEVLKKTEVADTEGVLERTSMINQLQQQLQAAQEEIKKLQGDLQTADRETVAARKRTEIAKFQADLQQSKGRMELGQELFNARLKDNQNLAKMKTDAELKIAKAKFGKSK